MSLSPLQTLCIVLGFIPGISTITGAIKAFVYFRESKKHDISSRTDLNETAEKTLDLAMKKFKSSQYKEISNIENEIGIWSMLEMIPLFNIVVAIDGLGQHLALARAKQNIKNFETDNNETFETYLKIRYLPYNVKDILDIKDVQEAMKFIYLELDDPNRSIDINKNCQVDIVDDIPNLVKEYLKVVDEKQSSTDDFKIILQTAIKNLIIERNARTIKEKRYTLEQCNNDSYLMVLLNTQYPSEEQMEQKRDEGNKELERLLKKLKETEPK